MEPLRPLADRLVHGLWTSHSLTDALTPPTKRELLHLLEGDLGLAGKRLPLFVALSGYTASLAAVAMGSGTRLEIPAP